MRSYGNYGCTYVYTHVYRTLRLLSEGGIERSERSRVSLTIWTALDLANIRFRICLKCGPAESAVM